MSESWPERAEKTLERYIEVHGADERALVTLASLVVNHWPDQLATAEELLRQAAAQLSGRSRRAIG